MQKLCPICKEKPAFNQKRGGYCRLCNNEYGRKNYQLNKRRYKEAAMKRANMLREIINAAKAKPCADCKNEFHPCQMDLDHLNPKDKTENVSYMLRHKYAVETIQEEIAKCEAVCANCHRLRHYNKTHRNPLTIVV